MESGRGGPKQVVLAGVPRCGTTLLATFLNAQQHCTFLGAYVDAFQQVADALAVRWDEPLAPGQRRTALLMIRDGFLRLHRPVLLQIGDFATLRELHERVLRDVASPNDRVIGYKNMLTADQVRRLLRETHVWCILVYRDPRDAAVSYWRRTGRGIEKYLDAWRAMVRLTQRVRHPRLVALKYEDMVHRPEETLGALGERLSLELRFDSAARFHTGAVEVPWSGNSGRAELRERFDAGSIGYWRACSTSPVVRYAQWFCRREMDALGYDSEPTCVNDRARFVIRSNAHHLESRLTAGVDWVRHRVIRRVSPVIRHDDH